MVGSPIATRLALKGNRIIVYNRDRSKAVKLVDTTGTKKLKIADQPKEVGDSSDIAIICVKDYQAVANISFANRGLIESAKRDLIVIQCSTISPEESSKLADLYSNRQINMLSVPLLGGTTAVERGEITLLGAGPRTAYELAESILRELSAQIFYLGSDHRTASALKLAFNIHIAYTIFSLTSSWKNIGFDKALCFACGLIWPLARRLICSRRVFPASLQSATFAAETSSGLRPQSVRARLRCPSCTKS
jgi:3-hydroxyisobutyrate dehydrogenase-like beta-hydroxyacid dehydrogenase